MGCITGKNLHGSFVAALKKKKPPGAGRDAKKMYQVTMQIKRSDLIVPDGLGIEQTFG
jgi:hypothetical protein